MPPAESVTTANTPQSTLAGRRSALYARRCASNTFPSPGICSRAPSKSALRWSLEAWRCSFRNRQLRRSAVGLGDYWPNAECAARSPADIASRAPSAASLAASLFLLAAWIAVDAAQTVWRGDRPEFSAIGVAVTAISLVVMFWLARAKRRVARELGSRGMEADAFQTTACWWLSLAALTGIGLNGALGGGADPVAGVVRGL